MDCINIDIHINKKHHWLGFDIVTSKDHINLTTRSALVESEIDESEEGLFSVAV